MLVDINQFKRINAQWGHRVGDKVLVSIVDIIQQSIRPDDILARLEGEVFAQLKKLHPQAVLIVSNQGGIEMGHVHPAMFQPKFIYVIASLQSFIGLNTLVAGQFCPYNDKKHPKRKPNPGMLEDMLAEFTHNTGINRQGRLSYDR